MKKLSVLVSVILLLSACQPELPSSNTESMEGLWIIENVQVGEEEMTPDARWIRFHSDSTQESGNGWQQHSYGSWSYNTDLNILKMNDKNGVEDLYPAFNINLKENQMQWKREEDGYPVTVNLKRTDSLPQSRADKMIGIWNLKTATKNEASILDSLQTEKKLYLYLAWDKRFTLGNTRNGRKRGVYFIHPHRPEIQLFRHSIFGIENWGFEINENELVLHSSSENREKVILEFIRGKEF